MEPCPCDSPAERLGGYEQPPRLVSRGLAPTLPLANTGALTSPGAGGTERAGTRHAKLRPLGFETWGTPVPRLPVPMAACRHLGQL